MLGTLGFSFDYILEQRGGVFRPDPATSPAIKVNNSDAATSISYDPNALVTRQTPYIPYTLAFMMSSPIQWTYGVSGFINYGSFNNGPGDYLVTFKEGGVEAMEIMLFDTKRVIKVNVPYLTVDVKNIYSFTRKDAQGKDVTVTYPVPYEHMDLNVVVDDAGQPIPQPSPVSLEQNTNDFIGKFNLSSYAWVNSRKQKGATKLIKQETTTNSGPFKGLQGAYQGQQGRYYLSVITGSDTVDFVNQLQIAGASFYFDYANKGKRYAKDGGWAVVPDDQYNYNGSDFKAGDQVMLKTTGGVFGLPMPGAKVKFKILGGTPTQDQYTDNLMDQIKVVPNPYYLSHQGQKSPYDGKIYLTRLPKQCKIDIYTVNGDLVQSIDHNETTSGDPAKEGIEVWNLLSKNGQRVQSQTLVAVITSSNGAKTIKEFSVVVGGFRIIEDN